MRAPHYPAYVDAVIQGKAYRILRENVSLTLGKFNLAMPEWTLLGLLHAHGPKRPRELADELGVEAPLVTVLIRQLAAKHLLTQSRHTTDNRAKLITLTEHAQQVIPQIEAAVHIGLQPLMQGVSREQVFGYFAVLEQVVKNSQQS